jgi:predicted metal-dependent phosphoesterase TrpH
MPFRCLFHLHTRHSFDSLLSPRKILARARELKVHALIVTDHNTIKGSLVVKSLCAGNSPIAPVAAEYQSEKGDLIGIFLKEEIRSRDSREIIKAIHAQGGLVVLPHPYKGHKLDDELLCGVDLIEIYNSRCSSEENARAATLAMQHNVPAIAGADAHCFSELNAALNDYSADPPANENELRNHLLRSQRTLLASPSSPLCRPYSQMVKAVKTGQPNLLLYQAKRLVLALARGDR